MPKRKCAGATPTGKPCGAAPIKGKDFCIAHIDAETQKILGFGGGQPGSGRPRKPRLNEIYEEVGEEMREKVRGVLNDALAATKHVVVGNGASAHVEEVPDQPLRLKAAAEIMDRLHGRPKQQTEVSGPEQGPIEFEGLPTAAEWEQAVARVLGETGAYGADPDQDQ